MHGITSNSVQCLEPAYPVQTSIVRYIRVRIRPFRRQYRSSTRSTTGCCIFRGRRLEQGIPSSHLDIHACGSFGIQHKNMRPRNGPSSLLPNKIHDGELFDWLVSNNSRSANIRPFSALSSRHRACLFDRIHAEFRCRVCHQRTKDRRGLHCGEVVQNRHTTTRGRTDSGFAISADSSFSVGQVRISGNP